LKKRREDKKRLSLSSDNLSKMNNNNIVSRVFKLLSPRCRPSEDSGNNLSSPRKQRGEFRGSIRHVETCKNDNEASPFKDENVNPKKQEIVCDENSLGWINPDLVLQKKPRVLQTSALGHGNEFKDEDFVELSKNLSLACNEQSFADVIFKIGPQQKVIRAHKVIIGHRSLYFRGIFSKNANKATMELTYPEFFVPIFESVIQYIYSGRILLTLDNVLDTLHLAEKFNIRSLQILCCEFIQSNVDYNNVCMVLKFISGYNCPRLFQFCLHFIDRNILSVMKSNSWLDLTEELLVTIIRRDEIEVKPTEEVVIFHGVLNWAKHNAKNQDMILRISENIFQHVRFPLMPRDDLTCIVEPSQVVPQELLMEAFKNHLVPQQSNHERFTSRLINSLKRNEESKKSIPKLPV